MASKRAYTTREFWIGAATAIAALVLLVAGFVAVSILAGGTQTDYEVSSEHPSPDGTRRAVLYIGMGGGAAGWCYQRLAVVGASDRFDDGLASVFDAAPAYVFSVSCGAEVTPRWMAPNELAVSYSASGPLDIYESPFTPDREVRLVFNREAR